MPYRTGGPLETVRGGLYWARSPADMRPGEPASKIWPGVDIPSGACRKYGKSSMSAFHSPIKKAPEGAAAKRVSEPRLFLPPQLLCLSYFRNSGFNVFHSAKPIDTGCKKKAPDCACRGF
jgi:hypothetical protein